MEKPIIFSTEMVKAILDGRKIQTRRVAKPQLPPKSPYEPGTTLWVRETWARISDVAEVDPEVGLLDGYIYKADDGWGNFDEHGRPKWHPSIYMPREAARIFLKVKGVRLERLKDITEEDAAAEGAVKAYPTTEGYYLEDPYGTYRAGFACLWDSINAKRGYGWDTNPWVWVISFEVQAPK